MLFYPSYSGYFWSVSLVLLYFIFVVTHLHLRWFATTCRTWFRPSPKQRRGTWRLLVNTRILTNRVTSLFHGIRSNVRSVHVCNILNIVILANSLNPAETKFYLVSQHDPNNWQRSKTTIYITSDNDSVSFRICSKYKFSNLIVMRLACKAWLNKYSYM